MARIGVAFHTPAPIQEIAKKDDLDVWYDFPTRKLYARNVNDAYVLAAARVGPLAICEWPVLADEV
jgi:hypothetical protein